MKKNLLISDSARRRLAPQLDKISSQLEFLEIGAKGVVQYNGKPADLDALPIQLGWFGRDVFHGGYAAEFMQMMLKAPALEWMQTLNAGLDSPVFKQFAQKGIRLSNSDAQAPAIAEYVVASVLHRYQNFELRRKHQQSHEWSGNNFRELYDSNWMVIGFGNIGSLVGKRVQAFQGHVTGVKRSAADVQGADKIITFEEIHDHLPDQDVVVLSCALSDVTRDIVNEQFLGRLKSDAVLVNIGRGGLVDEDALLTALNQDALDYAILDVFKQEPLPSDSAFWDHDRVLITPHSSNQGLGTGDRGDALFLHNLQAYLADEALRNEVDMSTLL